MMRLQGVIEFEVEINTGIGGEKAARNDSYVFCYHCAIKQDVPVCLRGSSYS